MKDGKGGERERRKRKMAKTRKARERAKEKEKVARKERAARSLSGCSSALLEKTELLMPGNCANS